MLLFLHPGSGVYSRTLANKETLIIIYCFIILKGYREVHKLQSTHYLDALKENLWTW